MSIVIDKILGQPLSHDHPVKNVSSDPASAKSGSLILNTTEAKVKIYYFGQWWIIADLTTQMLLDENGSPLLTEDDLILLLE
jgi:hypothetical protein